MEPVPETERMEEFRSSPLPPLRLQSTPTFTFASPTPLSPRALADPDGNLRKPSNFRRSTEPPSPSSPSWSSPSNLLPYRPRTASPLSGAHMRSRSTASAGGPNPPAMGRTQSMPGVNGAGHLQFASDPRASSPSLGVTGHRPPALTMRTPKKSLVEDIFPSSPTRISVLHDPDRQLHERNSSPNLGTHTLTTTSSGSTLSPIVVSQPLTRTRRPSSPYRRLSSTNVSSLSSPTLMSSASPFGNPVPAVSPAVTGSSYDADATAEGLSAAVVTEPMSYAALLPSRPGDTLLSAPSYSSLGGLSSSSIPSTPTSARSRSPSISSLETIPDSPDAEEAALEAERIAQLKAAADAAESGDIKGRSSLDVPPRGRTLGFGSRDKRKRWSVSGAERRGDLDLETIWED